MYHLEILTPEEIIFDGEVISLVAPGASGYLGVLIDHAPLITTLNPGIVILTTKAHEKFFYKISGGILEVKHNRVSLLADTIQSTESTIKVGGGI